MAYSQLEQQIRELRNNFQGSNCEGEQKVFYSLNEFRARINLSESFKDSDLIVALRYLHEVGKINIISIFKVCVCVCVRMLLNN